MQKIESETFCPTIRIELRHLALYGTQNAATDVTKGIDRSRKIAIIFGGPIDLNFVRGPLEFVYE